MGVVLVLRHAPNLLKIYSGYFVVANFFAGKGGCLTGATCGNNPTQAEPEPNGGERGLTYTCALRAVGTYYW